MEGKIVDYLVFERIISFGFYFCQ